jgi:hypothetical protein
VRIQTFIGKVSVEALHQMDSTINHWMEANHVEPKFVHQNFGYERHNEVASQEPVVVTSIFY